MQSVNRGTISILLLFALGASVMSRYNEGLNSGSISTDRLTESFSISPLCKQFLNNFCNTDTNVCMYRLGFRFARNRYARIWQILRIVVAYVKM